MSKRRNRVASAVRSAPEDLAKMMEEMNRLRGELTKTEQKLTERREQMEITEDERHMSEEIGRLNAILNRTNKRAREARVSMWWRNGVRLAIGLTVVCIGATVAWKAIMTPYVVDFCYITRETHAIKKDTFILKGHIPWHDPDRVSGEFPTLQEAVDASKAINCPVRP